MIAGSVTVPHCTTRETAGFHGIKSFMGKGDLPSVPSIIVASEYDLTSTRRLDRLTRYYEHFYYCSPWGHFFRKEKVVVSKAGRPLCPDHLVQCRCHQRPSKKARALRLREKRRNQKDVNC